MNQEFQAPPMSYTIGGDFDPNEVENDRVVLLALCIDASGSTMNYEDEFNTKLQEFLEEEQNSHIAEELFFQIVTFSTKVTIDSGWQPVIGFDTSQRLFQNKGGLTAGYDGVKLSIDSMLDYGKKLEMNGTDVRYNLCIITDGEFNEGSDLDGSSVRTALSEIRRNERLYGKFTAFMYGVGDEQTFEATAASMGLDPSALLRTGTSGQDFKKMLKTVSQSVSKSSSGTATPNF